MNINAKLFGRVRINDSEYDIGHAKFGELMIRASQVAHAHKGEAANIEIRLNKDKLLILNDVLSPEEAARREFDSFARSAPPADAVELFPGVTVAEAAEAEASPEGQAYKQLCNSSKRLGLSQSIIDEIKSRYFSRFPKVAPHYPIWQD